MATSEQPGKCLVCKLPTSEVHMGFNCCRACSVFYKRTLSRQGSLGCKAGDGECISKNPESNCRKCRFERFCSVLDECSKQKESDTVQSKSSNETEESKAEKDPIFLDHETSFQSDVSTSETPTLEKMKQAYRVLCSIRKNGEMATCSTESFGQLQQGNIKFINATYQNVVPNTRIMYTGIIEFFATVFDDFKKMSKIHQNLLVYYSFDILNKTDNLYRSIHHFPDDDTVMPSYTTTFSVHRVDEFMIDCPPGVDREAGSAELVKNTKKNLLSSKPQFKRAKIAPEEFVALLGLALWREEASTVDENINPIIKRNRATILRELHGHYSIEGRADYAARLGEVLCLLVNMVGVDAQHKEDIQVYKLMNMFT